MSEEAAGLLEVRRFSLEECQEHHCPFSVCEWPHHPGGPS